MSDQIKNLNHRLSKLEKAVHRLESIYAPRKQDKAGIPPKTASSEERDCAPREPPVVSPAPANSNPKNTGDNSAPRRNFSRRGWRQIKRIFLKRDRLERLGILFGIAYAV